MIRHSSIKNTFILFDSCKDQEIKSFSSAQRAFSYLGNCVEAQGKKHSHYGAFIRLLDGFDWKGKRKLDLMTCDRKKNYRLIFKKEIRR